MLTEVSSSLRVFPKEIQGLANKVDALKEASEHKTSEVTKMRDDLNSSLGELQKQPRQQKEAEFKMHLLEKVAKDSSDNLGKILQEQIEKLVKNQEEVIIDNVQKKAAEVKQCIIEESNEIIKVLDEDRALWKINHEKVAKSIGETCEKIKDPLCTKIDVYNEGMRNLMNLNNKKVLDMIANNAKSADFDETLQKIMGKSNENNSNEIKKNFKNIEMMIKDFSVKNERFHQEDKNQMTNLNKKITEGFKNSLKEQKLTKLQKDLTDSLTKIETKILEEMKKIDDNETEINDELFNGLTQKLTEGFKNLKDQKPHGKLQTELNEIVAKFQKETIEKLKSSELTQEKMMCEILKVLKSCETLLGEVSTKTDVYHADDHKHITMSIRKVSEAFTKQLTEMKQKDDLVETITAKNNESFKELIDEKATEFIKSFKEDKNVLLKEFDKRLDDFKVTEILNEMKTDLKDDINKNNDKKSAEILKIMVEMKQIATTLPDSFPKLEPKLEEMEKNLKEHTLAKLTTVEFNLMKETSNTMISTQQESLEHLLKKFQTVESRFAIIRKYIKSIPEVLKHELNVPKTLVDPQSEPSNENDTNANSSINPIFVHDVKLHMTSQCKILGDSIASALDKFLPNLSVKKHLDEFSSRIIPMLNNLAQDQAKAAVVEDQLQALATTILEPLEELKPIQNQVVSLISEEIRSLSKIYVTNDTMETLNMNQSLILKELRTKPPASPKNNDITDPNGWIANIVENLKKVQMAQSEIIQKTSTFQELTNLINEIKPSLATDDDSHDKAEFQQKLESISKVIDTLTESQISKENVKELIKDIRTFVEHIVVSKEIQANSDESEQPASPPQRRKATRGQGQKRASSSQKSPHAMRRSRKKAKLNYNENTDDNDDDLEPENID